MYLDYVSQFPEPIETAVETRFKIAVMSKAAQDDADYHDQLRQIVAVDAAAGDARTPRIRYLAAQSALVLTEELYQRFAEVELLQPFEQSLQEKQRRMDAALDAFGALVDYEVGEVTAAATFYMAEVYFDFSRALIASERPADLQPGELQDYEMALEEQAFPFEEQAIEVHEKNLELMRAGSTTRGSRRASRGSPSSRPAATRSSRRAAAGSRRSIAMRTSRRRAPVAPAAGDAGGRDAAPQRRAGRRAAETQPPAAAEADPVRPARAHADRVARALRVRHLGRRAARRRSPSTPTPAASRQRAVRASGDARDDFDDAVRLLEQEQYDGRHRAARPGDGGRAAADRRPHRPRHRARARERSRARARRASSAPSSSIRATPSR